MFNEVTKLAALLVELDVKELHPALNRYMDKLDKEKAVEISKVREAVDIIIDYLAEG